jgi:hypothetical protein
MHYLKTHKEFNDARNEFLENEANDLMTNLNGNEHLTIIHPTPLDK